MIKSPCYGCTNRIVGCHSRCEHYKEYKARSDEILNARHRESSGRYLEGCRWDKGMLIRAKRHKAGLICAR